LSDLGFLPVALAKYEKMLKIPLWDDTDQRPNGQR
jgi:hypothetical protein